MLQIRLRRVPSTEGGSGGTKPLPVETVTVACPDHLVIADLPVAKSLGSSTLSALVKTLGRRSRRQLGERVHFCVRCDFPIAVYGRLSPCEHAFCLDCGRSDSICYLCDERIQKIQTIKMIEGIFICAAPHCLKSFLKKTDFESHIHHTHADLLHPNRAKEEVNDSEPTSAKNTTASDSTVQAPPRSVFSPSSNSQVHDRDDKSRRPQPPRDQQPPKPFTYPKPSPQESGQFQDKQQGILSESPLSEYPMHPHQPPNFGVPLNPNPVLATPPFVYPPFGPDGGPSFYGAPFQMARPDSAPDVEPGQGSLLGFPPVQIGDANFSGGYPRPWNAGLGGGPFETSPAGQDSQGRAGFFQGDYERNKETGMDPREGKGILAPQPLQIPPPPPPLHPPQLSQMKRARFHSGDAGHDGHGFVWQHEKHDNFGGGQD